MAAPFGRATRLEEVSRQTTVEPLESGDPRYVDLSPARPGDELKKLGLYIRDCNARDNRFACVVLTGPRGCGKSTELLRLEHELRDRFRPLHLYVDDSLLHDCDYTDLMLWMTHELVKSFSNRPGSSLKVSLVDDVVKWFAEKSVEQTDTRMAETAVEAEAESGGKVGLFGVSLGILARLRSTFVGSTERRKTIRSTLQNYSTELIAKVNLLLDEAYKVLLRDGQELLIVQDNLDRLPREAGRRLFYDYADLLQRLRCHVIYTVPSAMVMAPYNVTQKFTQHFSVPTVHVYDRKGDPCGEGVECLLRLLDARIDVGKLFAKDVARSLVLASGGSVRDLMRLVNEAQLAARAAGKDRIDGPSAGAACKKLRIDYEKVLVGVPGAYALLAAIRHATRTGAPITPGQGEKGEDAELLAQLIFCGAVLEYNGEELWYDVHPVIQDAQPFKKACEALAGQAKARPARPGAAGRRDRRKR